MRNYQGVAAAPAALDLALVVAALFSVPRLIDGEEMPHLQRTSAPSAEETCPEFGGASDKLPRFWQN